MSDETTETVEEAPDLTAVPPVEAVPPSGGLVQVEVSLHWTCRRCGSAITPGSGVLQTDDYKARATPVGGGIVQWESVHYGCDPHSEEDYARIDTAHLAAPSDLYAATHRWGPWLQRTDWETLLRRVTWRMPEPLIVTRDEVTERLDTITSPPKTLSTHHMAASTSHGSNFAGKLVVGGAAALAIVGTLLLIVL